MSLERQVAALTEEIREVLDSYPAVVRGPALTYELAAALAESCSSLDQAFTLIDANARIMRDQVRALGVGRRHP